MASTLPPYIKYLSAIVLIFGILYKYEIPTTDNKTFLLTKKSTLQYNKSHVYQIITNIDRYALWYPNVARVEQSKPISSGSKKQVDGKYQLITKIPLIGDISSELTIHTKDRPKRFVYSVDSWLLEINSIELKDNSNNINSTDIQWTVYTKRRSMLFQYLILPFAKFYKNQLVREALFTLMLQIRNL
ncbi:unnamed protein product [Adineta steineri]|uniref:Uncharacterized protein n=1 Tax=Adineta steineri TaxID=433720 RepID=A0A818GBT9_9BILA|nr:unnamed protein product [Adineta steineri]CAF0835939.1 unnamed protein product [Adineta steineri]CAF0863943.1 unnamed protein product [Adineta steineri]CAF3487412.1 unnamed protein product [Adineta steineri]